ncbi:MAG: hypothetical protein OXI25_06365 [Chloroflexota bacterium]|nr:hypothetical protein [Chloroflexota bacterium]
MESAGWRAGWVWLGALTLALLLPLALFVRRSPEDVGLLPDGAASPAYRALLGARGADQEHSATVGEALRSPTLWLLTLATGVGLFSMSTNASSMVPYFESVGFTPAVAASGLAVYGAFSTASRFIWGYVADRLTVRRAIVLQSVLTAGGVALQLGVGNQTALFLIVAYHGLMLGGFVVLQPLIWPEYFGRRSLGAITGVTQFFTTFVLAAGPVFAGAIFDATDAYLWAYRTLVGTWLLTALLMVAVKPSRARSVVKAASAAP